MTADDRYLVVNPFFHSFGYKIGIVVGLLTGATLYPVATFDVDETMQLIQDDRHHRLPRRPDALPVAARRPRTARTTTCPRCGSPSPAPPSCRSCSSSGCARRRRRDSAIDNVVTAFGMTEAVVATMCRDGRLRRHRREHVRPRHPGDGGRIGDEGELLLRGEYVMLGYLDDPEATAEAIDEDGWLHTGDVGTPRRARAT